MGRHDSCLSGVSEQTNRAATARLSQRCAKITAKMLSGNVVIMLKFLNVVNSVQEPHAAWFCIISTL